MKTCIHCLKKKCLYLLDILAISLFKTKKIYGQKIDNFVIYIYKKLYITKMLISFSAICKILTGKKNIPLDLVF